MVASIGVIASPSQGVAYYEKDGYYARDDPAHREAAPGRAGVRRRLDLTGPVDAEIFQTVLEGKVPDGPHLRQARPGRGDPPPAGPRRHAFGSEVGLPHGAGRRRRADRRRPRPGRNTHPRLDRAQRRRDPNAGQGKRSDGSRRQSEDGGRNLPPRHLPEPRPAAPYPCGVANMVQGDDGKWRTMVNDGLYRNKMAIGGSTGPSLPGVSRTWGTGSRRRMRTDRFEIEGGIAGGRGEVRRRGARRSRQRWRRGTKGRRWRTRSSGDRAALMTRAGSGTWTRGSFDGRGSARRRSLGFRPKPCARRQGEPSGNAPCRICSRTGDSQRRRPQPGRWRMFPSARRCSAMGIFWRRRWPGSRGR